MLLAGYKGLSKGELEKLPVKELARITHEASQNWDKLYQRLNQDSTNSNKAPSTDSPEAKAKRKTQEAQSPQKHGGRKQGAQLGHKAVMRPLIPLSDGDRVIDCKPQVCSHCGESLKKLTDPNPLRWQYYDYEMVRHVT